MPLNVELSDTHEGELAAVAKRLGVTPEALASAVLRDLLSEPVREFERAAQAVLAKNAGLYRRPA